MGKARRKGVRKGFEGQQRFGPPERNGLGTFGTHRTGDMEDRRAARLRRSREQDERCHKFNDTGFEEA